MYSTICTDTFCTWHITHTHALQPRHGQSGVGSRVWLRRREIHTHLVLQLHNVKNGDLAPESVPRMGCWLCHKNWVIDSTTLFFSPSLPCPSPKADTAKSTQTGHSIQSIHLHTIFFFLAPDKTDYFWHVCPVINAYLEVHVTLSVPIFMHNPLERKKATERRGNTQKDRPLSPSAKTSSCSVAYPYRVLKRQTSNYSRVTRY